MRQLGARGHAVLARNCVRVLVPCLLALAGPPAGLAQNGPTPTNAGLASSLSGPVASISLPYNGALIRANVPVFGVADAPDFKQYRVEFGEGPDPVEWRTINVSTRRHPHDPWKAGQVKWSPSAGARGNLATWDTGLTSYRYGTPKDNLNGVYTLRVVVETVSGRTAEARLQVNVARVVSRRNGGIAESRDNMAFLTVTGLSVESAFLLVAITPVDELNPPLIDIKPPMGLIPLGKTYELQPPGVEFLKPASFRMHFSTEPSGKESIAAAAGRAGIYAYEPVSETWRRLPACQVFPDRGEVTTELNMVTPNVAFYAVLADVAAPGRPTLAASTQSTEQKSIDLSGCAEALATVEVRCGEKVRARVTADDRGAFAAWDVPLALGTNMFSARAIDAAGNESEPSLAVVVERRTHPPRSVTELAFVGAQTVSRGDRMLLRMTGEDADPGVNVARARVWSGTDTNGLELALTETGPDTGVFVATLVVGASTIATGGVIGAWADGEEIIAVALDALGPKGSIRYRDRTPPSAPTIGCDTHPSLVQNTFEATAEPFGDWQSIGGKAGALLETVDGSGCQSSASFGRFLRLTKKALRGHGGALACAHTFAVGRYPLLAFDYLIPSPEKLGLELDDGWLILFAADIEAPARTEQRDARELVGRLPGIVADGAWHHAELDLTAAMGDRAVADRMVKQVRFINWDMTPEGRIEIGRPGLGCASWCIDNFRIIGYGGREARFFWTSADEAGVTGYAYLLDQSSDTVPEPRPLGLETNAVYRGLADGRWFFHVRACDAAGNWGPANHHMIFVDDAPPKLEALAPPDEPPAAGSPLIRVVFDDGTGSGMNPASLIFRVGGLAFAMGSTSVTYDAAARIATFDPAKADPQVVLFAADSRTGDVIQFEAADCAGHRATLAFAPVLSASAASPLRVTPPVPDGSNGWYTAAPRIKCEAPPGASVAYSWDVAPEDDEWFRKGNSINTLVATVVNSEGRTRRYAKGLRLDSTVPDVTARIDAGGRIVLDHGDYAWAPGALNCTIESRPGQGAEAVDQEAGLDLVGVDPGLVCSGRIARWRGMLNVRQAGIYAFRIRPWTGQSVRLVVDGEELGRPEKTGTSTDANAKPVLLRRGLHPLEVVAQADVEGGLPVRMDWACDGRTDEDSFSEVPSDVLLALRPLARIFYRWADVPDQVYTGPIPAPRAGGVLRCRAEDEAGHRGPERSFDVAALLKAVPTADNQKGVRKP